MNKLPLDFNYKTYLALNKDLDKKMTMFEAASHYLQFGKNQNRNYKKNINILVTVLSCRKHSHLWYEITKRTNNIIIFTGSDKNENFYDKKSKIMYLNCNDNYEGLPEKMVLMIEQILTLPEFKNVTHILKIDDHDTYFTDENIKNLYNLNELHFHNYIGQKKEYRPPNTLSDYHFGKISKNSHWNFKKGDVSDVTWLDGGCSYILSRKAMKLVNKTYNSSNINIIRNKEIFEDVMMGRLLASYKIRAHEVNYNIKGDK
jgi:hypothetical protein